jgi:ABC-2 type transport system permease protein
MSTAVASFRVLAGHDFRLARRRVEALFRDASGRRALMMMAGAFLLFHLLALPVADWLNAASADDSHGADLVVAAAFLFVLPWIVSQALTNATRALYSRGDLDLLLSSPVPARSVFAARALSIAFESIISVAIFLLPVADMLAWKAGPRWLAIYPTLVACGLSGTAIGLVLTMVLFRIAGPRRTRLLAQIFATLVGASFAIGLQIANLAPVSLRALLGHHDLAAGRASILDVIRIPVAAAGGDPVALVITLALSIALFAAVCFLLAEAFTRGFVQAADLPATRRQAAAKQRRFRSGAMATIRRKEWRLVMRDPWLASQMLLQIAYTLPLCFILWQSLGAGSTVLAAIAPAIVIIAAQFSGALAFVTLSTEDAPEFLRTAPLTRAQIERAKLSAIAILLAVLIGVPVLAMAWDAPLVAAMTLTFAGAGALSTALLNLWRAAPGRRGDLMRREGQPKIIGILEHVLSLFWAVAAALANAGSLWFAVPAALACAVLWLNYDRAPGRA